MNRKLAGLFAIWELAAHAMHREGALDHAKLWQYSLTDLQMARSWAMGASFVLPEWSSEWRLARKMQDIISDGIAELLELHPEVDK